MSSSEADNFAPEEKEEVCKHLNYIERFEVARWPQDWWGPTMRSFNRTLHSRDDFLLDQVNYCNETMPKEEPWQWWMLIEFTKSKKLHLQDEEISSLIKEGNDSLVKYLNSKDIHVFDLTLNGLNERPPPNLQQLFPDLRSLHLNGVCFENGLAVVLPSKIEELTLNDVQAPRTSLSSIVQDPSKLKKLHLTGLQSGFIFDGDKFTNIRNLSLDFKKLSSAAVSDENSILRSILLGNKGLTTLSLRYAEMNAEWLQMFPSNVVNLEFLDATLKADLIVYLDENVLYERMALTLICEDWKSVSRYTIDELHWRNIDNSERQYRIKYFCKPIELEEEIVIKWVKHKFDLKQLIERKTFGLEWTTLEYSGKYFRYTIPKNIKHLVASPDIAADIKDHEDPSMIETLELNWFHSLLQSPKLTNLRKLLVWNLKLDALRNILVSCTSLVELKLNGPDKVFKELKSGNFSASVKHLCIVDGNDTFEDILKPFKHLETLILDRHAADAILSSKVNAVQNLQYFKAVVEKKKEVAEHLSKLEFPYMIFAATEHYDFYAASKGREVMKEISAKVAQINLVKAERSMFLESNCTEPNPAFVYSKNIPTKFLRNSNLVVETVKEFVDKH